MHVCASIYPVVMVLGFLMQVMAVVLRKWAYTEASARTMVQRAERKNLSRSRSGSRAFIQLQFSE